MPAPAASRLAASPPTPRLVTVVLRTTIAAMARVRQDFEEQARWAHLAGGRLAPANWSCRRFRCCNGYAAPPLPRSTRRSTITLEPFPKPSPSSHRRTIPAGGKWRRSPWLAWTSTPTVRSARPARRAATQSPSRRGPVALQPRSPTDVALRDRTGPGIGERRVHMLGAPVMPADVVEDPVMSLNSPRSARRGPGVPGACWPARTRGRGRAAARRRRADRSGWPRWASRWPVIPGEP